MHADENFKKQGNREPTPQKLPPVADTGRFKRRTNKYDTREKKQIRLFCKKKKKEKYSRAETKTKKIIRFSRQNNKRMNQ